MIDTKTIKDRVLSLAFQGRLVETKSSRISNDNLESIHRQVKGYIPVSEEEFLINAPQEWNWTRLGYITCNHGQKTPSDTFSYIDVGTLDNVNHRLSSTENIVEAKDAPSRAKKVVEKGDVIYSTVRPYLHNICIIDKDFSYTPIASTAFCVMQANETVLYNRYLFYWLLTKEFDKYSNGDPSKGALYPAIGEKDLLRGTIPLPSIAEQEEIVEKIEAVFEILDKIDALQEQYASNQEALKSKLIDAAIQGKVTEQLPEDGTAEEFYKEIQKEKEKLIRDGKIKKEKTLPDITDAEVPFEIPANWKWVRFGNLMRNRDSERIPVSLSDRKKIKKIYDYYGASGVIDKVEEYLFDEKLLLIGEDGANLLSRSTPIAFIANGKYWVNNHAHVLDYYCSDYLDYVMHYINSISLVPYVTGSAQPKLNQDNMNKIPIPLPPLSEMKRIVDFIESITKIADVS